MKTKSITHVDYSKKLCNTLNLAEQRLSSENYKLLVKYDRELTNSSIGVSTRVIQLQQIKTMTEMLDKNWSKITKEDIEDLIYAIMKKYGRDGKESFSTKGFKMILKPFVRWLKIGIREHRQSQKEGIVEPIEIRRIVMKAVKSKMTKEDLLTDKERANLLAACNGDLRNRALVAVLDESGTRAGEVLTRQIKHVRKDEYGIVLSVDGKTGTRPIRLITSAPILAQWLNVHPLKDDPEAALFIKTRKPSFGEPLSYFGARQVILKVAKDAKITKRVHMHLMRHTAATQTSSFLNEQQQKLRYGWAADSKMTSKYQHFNNEDVDNALLEHYGIETSAKKSKPDTPIICQTCKELNPHDSQLCLKCSRPLNLETATKLAEEKSKKETEKDEKMIDMQKQIDRMESLFEKLSDAQALKATAENK